MEDLFKFRDRQAEKYRKRINALCRRVERQNERIAELEAGALFTMEIKDGGVVYSRPDCAQIMPEWKRDQDNPCDEYEPGPIGVGDCETDGHYLCGECRHRNPDAAPDFFGKVM